MPDSLARPSGLLLLLAVAGLAQAETAEMLPAGVSHLRYQFTLGRADDGYDRDGNRKSLAELYRAALEDAGLTTAVPSVYRIDTGASYEFVRQDLYYEYGLTDAFNLGLWTYYVDQKANYSAKLHQEAGWGMLTAVDQATLAAATEAADVADGSSAALGDTVLGLKHRLLGDNESALRFAYYLGARLPTGHVADPTDPGDLSVGDGQTDLGVWFALDWQPTPNLLLNLHTRHEYQFEGSRDAVDPADPNHSLSQRFQPGVYHYAELFASYRVPRPAFNGKLELTAIYEDEAAERAQRYDAVTGSYRGAMQKVADSDNMLLSLEPAIGFDLFPSDLPLEFKLYGRVPVAGRNTLAPEYVGVRLDAYW